MLGDVSHMTIPELEEWGVGLNVGIAWEDALHSALMPITPQASMGSLADGKGVWLWVWLGVTSTLIPFTPQTSMGSLVDGKGCGYGCD